MRIKSNTIFTGIVIVIRIITFVGGLRSIFVFNPSRDGTYSNVVGGIILICLGLAPFIYGTVTIHDYIIHRKEKDEETKVYFFDLSLVNHDVN